MDWDNETFYNFILEGLGRRSQDGALTNQDGTLTGLNRFIQLSPPQKNKGQYISHRQAHR
ncbi:MAG: hypothetical protein P8Y40_13240 [Desulfobacterales bacterium]